jgi:hypothetical protein
VCGRVTSFALRSFSRHMHLAADMNAHMTLYSGNKFHK